VARLMTTSATNALGRDKLMSQHWAFNIIDANQLEAAYRGDWVARKIIEIPAFDSTRAWRTWQADKEDVKAIEKTERCLGLQNKMLNAMIKARLYGGAALGRRPGYVSGRA
jgi:uncharacterized protein